MKPKNGKHFELMELQQFVKGYIEHVPLYANGTPNSKDLSMICNEEGKMKGLPFNELATTLFRSYHNNTDFIVGDVLVCDAIFIQ